MKTLSSTYYYALTSAGALLIYLCFCWWFMAISPEACLWVDCVLFFAYSWYCARLCMDKGKSMALSVVAIILGRVTPIIPLLVLEFRDTYASMIYVVASVASIILATLCSYEKKVTVYVLSIIITILINTFVYSAWMDWVNGLINTYPHG